MEKKTEFKNIYQKLLSIQQKVMGLGKDAKSFGYGYVTGSKALEHIKPLMNELGLILKQEVIGFTNERQDYATKNGSKSEILTKVDMKFTWIDTETGEKDENFWGANGQNDWEKGFGSALTYGERYFLLKYFHIATDEDDIDNPKRETSEPIPAKAPITSFKEDTEAQRVANMQGVKVPEITIEEHKTAINSIPSAVGLVGYFNSLTSVEKTNQDIIALLSARREELKVNTEK
jgi:hypothetical protein